MKLLLHIQIFMQKAVPAGDLLTAWNDSAVV